VVAGIQLHREALASLIAYTAPEADWMRASHRHLLDTLAAPSTLVRRLIQLANDTRAANILNDA
jgi:hypothetical protein